MDDIWMLAFIFNGLIGAAGSTMPLKQCEAWARELGPNFTYVTCVNVKDPTCRVYRDPSSELREWQQDLEKRCRRRNKPQKDDQ
ncbi:hypothetical protein [Comamonas sp. 4034]|uniref:hypothetical protein n=1 Tax=Comamonas sp. 4034 TaxID=3156455 RepID=UPI003D1CE850